MDSTCWGTLNLGDSSGSATSQSPTYKLYRKSAAISIRYKNNNGEGFYDGNSSNIYNTTSAASTVCKMNSGNISMSASGSHYFETDAGLVKNYGTYV